jgi:hypothetical protein
MKSVCLVIVALGAALNAATGFACSVLRIAPPEELVHDAELIVLATAIDYAGPPPGNSRTTGVPANRVRFRVDATLKGTHSAPDLALNGYLGGGDDWNENPVPYSFVRPGGRSGSCFANTYKTGGQFVLMLRRSGKSTFEGDTEFTVNWGALAAVNEQVRSADDPWVRWVKEQIQAQSANTFGVVFRSDSQRFVVTDRARLDEIRKKMDEIDFWNAEKFKPVFFDQTCRSQNPENIEITATRGTVRTITFIGGACANNDKNKPAQELLSLIELIKRAAPAKP